MACETEQQAVASAMVQVAIDTVDVAIAQATLMVDMAKLSLDQMVLSTAQSALQRCQMGGMMKPSAPSPASIVMQEGLAYWHAERDRLRTERAKLTESK